MEENMWRYWIYRSKYWFCCLSKDKECFISVIYFITVI